MEILKIRFFGRFTISAGDKCVADDGERGRKQWRLIKYLILNRDRAVSKRELIDATFGYGAYSGRPSEALNALNAMIHRARATLESVGLDGASTILFRDNAYRFVLPDGAELDCEMFDRAATQVFSCNMIEDIMPHALSALDLYSGFFLNKSAFDEKTRLAVERYHDTYKRIFTIACGALRRSREFSLISRLSEKACAIDPFCEDFYTERVDSLLSLGKVQEAKAAYFETCELFGSKTSIIVSERFKVLGGKFSASDVVSVILSEKYSNRANEITSALKRIIPDADVKILLK